jgi:hypothetical protein
LDAVLHPEEHASEVDHDHAFEILDRAFRCGCLLAFDACVVEEDVEAAETLDGGADHPGNVVLIGNVGQDRDGMPAGPFDLICDVLGAALFPVGYNDVRPLAGEEQRRRPADPGGTAGDDRCLPVESAHRCPPSRALSPPQQVRTYPATRGSTSVPDTETVAVAPPGCPRVVQRAWWAQSKPADRKEA